MKLGQVSDIQSIMEDIGKSARAVEREVASLSSGCKNQVLQALISRLSAKRHDIIKENDKDVEEASSSNVSGAMLDRLRLSEDRIDGILNSLHTIIKLQDPVKSVIQEWDRPNGLHIKRVRSPLGVVGVIYESRPNVTIDAGALCFKSGNVVILRGGSECLRTNLMLHKCFAEALVESGVSDKAVQIVPFSDRNAVSCMLGGLHGCLDLIIPRGGRALVEQVNINARVPVLAHMEGICHVYVDGSSDVDMAVNVVLNSKMRRPGICGATECLLVDKACVATHLFSLVESLMESGCEVRGDETVQSLNISGVKRACDNDWGKEFLDKIIAVRVVNGVQEAVNHIITYSSQHTDAIITNDDSAREYFFNNLDSAILLHNASTQFADGGEFGMGAEIGIATGKIHARGPVGLEQLTSFQYQVLGEGTIRSL